MTLDPRAMETTTLPRPVPEFVIVPMAFTFAVETVIPAAKSLLLFRMRFPVPITPPERVSRTAPAPETLFVTVVPPLFTVKAPLTVRAEVGLDSVIAVTFVPTGALNKTLPAPVPELVIVPTGFTLVMETVRALATSLLFLRIKLPVPVTPPETVKRGAVTPTLPLMSVVPLMFTATAPLTVRGDVRLAWVIEVTLPPIPPLKVVVATPVPELITAPVKFTSPAKVIPAAAGLPLTLTVRLLVPVTTPLMVAKAITPVLVLTWIFAGVIDTAPVPRFKAKLPPKVKSPFQV